MKTIRAEQVKVHIIAYFALHNQYGIIAKKLNLTQTTTWCELFVTAAVVASSTPYSNQNLKHEKFTSLFGSLRQKIAPKSVLHVQHNYFFSFNRSSHRHARGEKKKKILFFFISHHTCLALCAKKTPMNVAIPPVVQAIEQQETRGKTRFFSATTLSFICMTIINSAQHCKSGVIIAVI